jgi:mannitol/fructose-specific phosphotransferase system IIA component (Ntr-type)
MATLSDDKKSVNFDYSVEQLDNWQVELICQLNSNNDDKIRKFLKKSYHVGRDDEAIEEFIEFKNSDLINEMIKYADQ